MLINIKLPASIRTIGESAFEGCINLRSVEFPYGTKNMKIEDRAFRSCESLKVMNLPQGVVEINQYAFAYCKSLKELTIPSTVYNIKGGNLTICDDNLEKIVVDDKNYYYDSRDSCNAIIEKSTNMLIAGCPKSIIPNTVRTIRGGAFQGQKQLKYIFIPSSVVDITQSAFRYSGLETIEFEKPNYALTNNSFTTGMDSLKTIISLETAPDDIPTNCFQNNTYVDGVLIVPQGTTNKYMVLDGWKKFNTIIEKGQKFMLTYMVDGEEYKSSEMEYGATITPEAAPTKEGCTFSGWSEIPATMPAHDVTVTGTFRVNSYKLTYMIDDKVYKETMYEYGATITPEPQPKGDYATFEWTDLPTTMPAHDVTVHAAYTSEIAEIIMAQDSVRIIYVPDGKSRKELQKGLNIVVATDGKTKKVIVK